MTSLMLFLKNQISWTSLLFPLPFLFLGFGYSVIIFTSSAALILSTFFFTSSKENPYVSVEKLPEAEAETEAKEEEEEEELMDKSCSDNSHQTTEDVIASIHEQKDRDDHRDYFVRSPDHSSNTEDSECGSWPYRENTDFSDGSISDEESLIELCLPSGHYVGHYDQFHYKEEEKAKRGKDDEESFNKIFLQKNFQGFTPRSLFPQRTLMQLLAEFNEMNEEDNLIEIDISMGSIKCTRFEIEA